jgi:hypothetical protein
LICPKKQGKVHGNFKKPNAMDGASYCAVNAFTLYLQLLEPQNFVEPIGSGVP